MARNKANCDVLEDTKPRPFACPEPACSARFRRKFALREHVKIHTGEKPYLCTIKSCGQRFRTSGNYKRHKRLHAVKKFACHVKDCSRVFGKAESLSRHISGHLGRMTGFACPIDGCEKTFTTSGNAKRHMRTHHSIIHGLDKLTIEPTRPALTGCNDTAVRTILSTDEPAPAFGCSGIEPLDHDDEPLSSQDLSMLLQCLFADTTVPVVPTYPPLWTSAETAVPAESGLKTTRVQEGFALDTPELIIAIGLPKFCS